ncbi:MAG: class I SAM-dependent RNA methyltransferase [Clostridia bacterium]|nr:class I SAM-dependent RNA methyltransferase [Clostridia bacterium]
MYTFVATCLFGLEHLLGEEITALGYKRTETIDGRVTFEGDIGAAARMNIFSRYAERVFIQLSEFPARSFTELFDGVKRLEWESWISKTDAFPVKGHCIKSTLFSVPDCQSIIKKAIVQRLESIYGISWFKETGVKYQIEFFIFHDKASIMIDTSGIALHKRGYRPQQFTAPLRETLGAALAATARPREDVLFWDPFCGSGTIAIEAAMMMTGRAPGLKRGFAGEAFPQIGKELWQDAREEAKAAVKKSDFQVFASDIDPAAVELARECCKHAGVEDTVKVFCRDALTIKTEGRRGTIVCNPPYGERISAEGGVDALYRNMGRHFSTLDSWQIYILTSHPGFQNIYGRRADKVRKLYNGMLPCYFYQYFKRNK